MPAASKRKTSNGLRNPYKKRKYGTFSPYTFPAVRRELKFHDQSAGGSAVGTAGNIIQASMHTIAAGTGENQRIGRKLTLTSLHLRYVIQKDATAVAGDGESGVRVIVYWDKQCNGTAATVTDILETASYLSYNNLSNKNRFQILMDRMHDVNCMSGLSSSLGAAGVTRSWNKKVNIPVEYSSTTGAIGEIRSNNVGVLIIRDGSVAQYSYQSRVRYADS